MPFKLLILYEEAALDHVLNNARFILFIYNRMTVSSACSLVSEAFFWIKVTDVSTDKSLKMNIQVFGMQNMII